MENASNALLMAGSILLSVLILGAVVMMFNQFSQIKEQEQSAKEVQIASKFNEELESYNRKMLYGTDIISISNLIEDYLTREEGNLEADLLEIEVEIKLKKMIPEKYGNDLGDLADKAEPEYEASIDALNNNGTLSASAIELGIQGIESTVEKLSEIEVTGQDGIKYTYEYLAPKDDRDIKQLLYGTQTPTGTDITANGSGSDFLLYRDSLEMIKSFKRKIFTCKGVGRDASTGRITSMNFEEID